ncbi:MAG: hypothetical protein QOE54_3686 [Streptosporangiaceae bacterium]|nr:hypothetical protein [Streptosporangiaceae bacterium]
MRLSRLIALAMLAAPTAVPAAVLTPAQAVDAQRVETPVVSSSPVTGVAESMVSLRIPLPSSVGPHPAACDLLSYLRWRDRNGPADRTKADRILIAQPGIFEGAGAFDSVARNTVAAAAKKGLHFEFWALDRRSNCLEDHTGDQAGLAAKSLHTAVDYYYRHKKINGRTFAGYQTSDQLPWVAHLGLAQTLTDEYDVMRYELPSASFRRQKVFCGGHSLGGFLTGYFAEWDFDGDPATTADAGYNQCAGYFALDSAIAASAPGLGSTIPSGILPSADSSAAWVNAELKSGRLTRIVAAPVLINPETMNLLGIAGLGARLAPTAESDLVRDTPSNPNIDATLRLLFSRDYPNFVSGRPGARDFRLTGNAVLGALLDNNSQPLAFLETSVGFVNGGTVADKTFPLPSDLVNNPSLPFLATAFGKDKQAIPVNVGSTPGTGPLYGWLTYDQIGTAADPGYRSSDGTLFTTRAKEVTDIAELARSMSEAPLDFTEWYFPTKMVTDLYLSDSAEIKKYAVHTGGIAARPVLTLRGGSGVPLSSAPTVGTLVIVSGYHHIDVLTAAATQNDGKPEPVSTNLVRFATGH